MNIGGNAKYKLTKQHPFIHRILTKHSPETLAFNDTRCIKKPNWKIEGYTLKFFMPGEINSNVHIGGCMIFIKNRTNIKIQPIKKHNDINIGWVKINNIILCIAYCRPWEKKTKT